MGAAVTSTNPADFANRLQTYFNPKLLSALDFNLVLAKFGLSKDYPAIGTTIRFFRPRAPKTGSVVAVTEGTTPVNLTEVAVGYVDVALSQRGALATVTDLVQAVDLLDTVRTYVTTMGNDAALDLDAVVRNALVAGVLNSNTTYTYGPTAAQVGYPERFGSVNPSGVSATDFAALQAATPANSKMTRIRHLTAITQLKAARVPTINGRYVAACSPAIIHDMRQDVDWVTAATRVDSGNLLFKRAELDLDGAVFIENDNGFIENDVYGTYDDVNEADDNGNIYSTLYLGAEAFGVPTLTSKRAGGSQMSPRIAILASADKSDPLNLKTAIAWKAFYGCKPFITNVAGEFPHYVNLRTKSTFV
jgi:N4-gp56 family major capsid protein